MSEKIFIEDKILLAGEFGFVGSNIKQHLIKKNFTNFVVTPESIDYRNQQQTSQLISQTRPNIVIIAAGKVGGINENRLYPAQFIYENLMIWLNLIHSCYELGVKKMIFLGSSTVYPQNAQSPFKEEYMGTGVLDKNTEPYAIAKIAAIKLCEHYYKENKCNFIPLTLSNLYGPQDHFNTSAHVVPALIAKFHIAKTNNSEFVEVLGTGKATRDLLYVEDLVDAILFAMLEIDACDIFDNGATHLNVGTGNEVAISELINIIADVVGFKGKTIFSSENLDGVSRKVLDVNRMTNLGWKSKTTLRDGIKKTYSWFVENVAR